MNIINIGIIGFGTVGAGVAESIMNNADIITKRVGFTPVVKRIADLDITTDRGISVPEGVLTTNAEDIFNDPDIQIVVELVGGTTIAKTFILKALNAKKNVVTANKALLAHYGEELFAAVEANGVELWFEASVGGGIPCIKALREGLAANHIKEILGILNGTCNYILTRMEMEKANFEDVLAAAQKAGYAEANPSLDVDGFDTAHKCAILASLAFGHWFSADDVETEGIRSVTPQDIETAAGLGFRIKLLAIIKENNHRIQLGVHPVLVPMASLIGNVNDVFNAVWIKGDVVGNTMYYGRGAGRQATSSAVVSDIIDCGINICNGCLRRLPPFKPYDGYNEIMATTEISSRFYIRLQIVDKPGVLAKVASILGNHNINIATASQREGGTPSVSMIILTHKAECAAMAEAIAEIEKIDVCCNKPVVFRIEDLA
ncbi:MAG: homoserine dehydrogenase [Victivallales bacterium]|nr:homoserine dehydrogenase [Victivallales bacterium]